MRNPPNLIVRGLAIILLLAVWWATTRNQTVSDSLAYPSPESVIAVLAGGAFQIAGYAGTTTLRLLMGYAVGSVVGICLGLLMFSTNIFREIADTYIEIVRPVPPVALTPFFILWFGIGSITQIALIATVSVLVFSVSTLTGATQVDEQYQRVARTFGASKWLTIRRVIVPAIMPGLESAARVAAAGCWSVTIAAEYLGAQGGLGYMIRNARMSLHTETILVAAIILGLLSLSMDAGIRAVFSRINSWKSLKS